MRYFSHNNSTRISPLKSASYDVLILDAETRQGLASIRSLGKKGLRVAGVGNYMKKVPAFHSRWCTKGFYSPAAEGTDEYFKYLLEIIKNNTIKVIIPCSDGTITVLRRYRKELSKYTTIALASNQSIQAAINKNETLAIAEKIGIKIPHSIKVSKKEEVGEAIKKLPFPIVIKPAESWVENKLNRKRVCSELAVNTKEAYRSFERLSELGGETIFQEYLPGKREAISFIFHNSTFYARFAQWAKRTQPPLGGMSVLRESIPIPEDIGKQSENLIRTINLEGYSEVEFRRDSHGTAYLMEINPRLSASVEVGLYSDVDFPHLIYQLASGEKIDSISKYKTGIWERYLAGDIVNCIQTIQEHGRPGINSPIQTFSQFIITFFKPMKYDYLDWSDPKPAITASYYFFERLISKFYYL